MSFARAHTPLKASPDNNGDATKPSLLTARSLMKRALAGEIRVTSLVLAEMARLSVGPEERNALKRLAEANDGHVPQAVEVPSGNTMAGFTLLASSSETLYPETKVNYWVKHTSMLGGNSRLLFSWSRYPKGRLQERQERSGERAHWDSWEFNWNASGEFVIECRIDLLTSSGRWFSVPDRKSLAVLTVEQKVLTSAEAEEKKRREFEKTSYRDIRIAEENRRAPELRVAEQADNIRAQIREAHKQEDKNLPAGIKQDKSYLRERNKQLLAAPTFWLGEPIYFISPSTWDKNHPILKPWIFDEAAPIQFRWFVVPENIDNIATRDWTLTPIPAGYGALTGKMAFDFGVRNELVWPFTQVKGYTVYCVGLDPPVQSEWVQEKNGGYRLDVKPTGTGKPYTSADGRILYQYATTNVHVVAQDDSTGVMQASAQSQLVRERPKLDRLFYLAAKDCKITPIKNHYTNRETGTAFPLSLFETKSASDPRKTLLLDFTPMVDRKVYEGFNLQEAIDEFREKNSYPKGDIWIDANHDGVAESYNRFQTRGESTWQIWSRRYGTASLGIGVIGGIAAAGASIFVPAAVPVIVQGTAILAGATAVVSVGLDIAQLCSEAEVRKERVALNVLTLVSALLPYGRTGLGALSNGRSILVRAASGLGSGIGRAASYVPITIKTGVYAGQTILVVGNAVPEIQAILDSSRSRIEKEQALVSLLSVYAVMGGLMVLSHASARAGEALDRRRELAELRASESARAAKRQEIAEKMEAQKRAQREQQQKRLESLRPSGQAPAPIQEPVRGPAEIPNLPKRKNGNGDKKNGSPNLQNETPSVQRKWGNIESFKQNWIEEFLAGNMSKADLHQKIPPDLVNRTKARLEALMNAQRLEDLKNYELHRYLSYGPGGWTMYVDKANYRIIFRWRDGAAHDVDVVKHYGRNTKVDPSGK